MAKKISIKKKAHLTPKKVADMNTMLKGDKTVVLLHASWCPHCVSFAPEWNMFERSSGINTINIESDPLSRMRQDFYSTFSRLTPKDDALSYPTIMVFSTNNGKTSKKVYTGVLTAKDLKKANT